MFLTPEEWKTVKDRLVVASPKLLLILAVLVIGYLAGWHMKANDIAMDCKYANAFRVQVDSFACSRKI